MSDCLALLAQYPELAINGRVLPVAPSENAIVVEAVGCDLVGLSSERRDAVCEITGATPRTSAPERVEAYKQPSAVVLHEALRADGEEALQRATSSLLWSGVAGGLSMGLSLVAAGLLHAHLPAARWRALLTSLGFSLGFVVVILGRQGLITESALTGMLPALSHPRRATIAKTARLWGAVLTGNMVGAALFAFAAARAGLFPADVQRAFAELGHQALAAPFGTRLLRGVLAGWIIGLALWISPAAGPARVVPIVLLTWLVGAAHFGHIVSGSVEALTAVFAGRATPLGYVGGFFVPVLVGNLVGGGVLVAALNHAQVARERRALRRRSRVEPASAGGTASAPLLDEGVVV